MNEEHYQFKKGISIIVPALNEEGNIKPLIRRINSALVGAGIEYEVILIDDHSKDKTKQIAQELSRIYPIKVHAKIGQNGKARSLLEGFSYANHDLLCMIDADLQYPPESIPEMIEMIRKSGTDIVVANRLEKKTSFLRRLTSNTYRLIFGKLLFGLTCDIQSGLKVFRREILNWIEIKPSPWAFDLEFLVRARERSYSIGTIPIVFAERTYGKAKVGVFRTAIELAIAAIKIKLSLGHAISFRESPALRHGSGFYYKGRKFVTHNYLNRDQVAIYLLNRRQSLLLALALILWIAFFVLNWHGALVTVISVLTITYFLDLLFNLFLVYKSFFASTEVKIMDGEIAARGDNWPKYTIFCPLYKEWRVLPQFIRAISQLDYPKEQLEVLLLLEEDDIKTINVARNSSLPAYFKVVVVPHSLPKTKPKACNYGLSQATGELAVIYDAEDIPEKLQLKKAVIAFSKVEPNIACIQAKLNYYNAEQNLLTRLFTLEYSLWFDLVLTGLQSINAPIPLGGTSNHFRTADLNFFEGWDPFNVTEDADLGMRIAQAGYKTAILDSTTMEEANSQVANWFKQRSRWVKGYIQTYFVHTRSPQKFVANQRKINLLFFQLVIGGKVMSLIINPLMWIMTIIFFAMRVHFGDFIQSLYVVPVFYIAIFALIVGNFLYLYYYIIGAAKRGKWELIPYSLLIPIYWIMMSAATYFSIYDLLIRPFHWYKTTHGLHLAKEEQRKNAEILLQDAI